MTPEISSAIELIRNPELLNRNTIPVLREAIRQYPYHQTLYLLLLQNLYKVHDPQFGSALREYAPMVADRAVLFDMVEGMNYNIPLQKLDDDEVVSDGDRTLFLIDNFLRSIPDAHDGKAAKSDTADPQSDYSAYLEQLPDYESEDDLPAPPEMVAKVPDEPSAPAEEPEQVSAPQPPVHSDDEFTVASIRQHLAEADDQPPVEEPADDTPKEEFYTEAMAAIYIKQQKFGQALEIIKAISTSNPKKSVYFAEQIRYLELLKRINERKKQ